MATLPTGQIGYIEVPITNEKSIYYQGNDINTLINNVTHTYHPEITEVIPQQITLQYKNDTVPFHQIPLNQIFMTNSDTPPINSSLYNLQLTSHTSNPTLDFFPHYHTLQKILNLKTNSISSSLILQTPSILHSAIY